MASSVSGSEVPEGPVLTVITKRLRALKKKYNRIISMEQTHLASGKALNKEQSDLLNSKVVVAALIDEYEKLRQPLAAAVQEELSSSPSPSSPPSEVEDLLGLLYFASLFDVKPQSEFTSMMLTRTHERGCCLTYDYVTDDATELLGERDLDLIATVGGMMVSRPVYSGVSHRDALEGCVRHAGLWLRNADQPVGPGCDLTYVGLREKLKKIMASDYFTTTPEMKAPVDVAAAVGKYGSVPAGQVEGQEQEEEEEEVDCADQAHYDHKQEDELEDVQAIEVSPGQSNPVDESPKDEVGECNPLAEVTTAHQEQEKLDVESEEQNQGETDHKEQQQYIPRRQYQNQRGGSRGGGGGRRGYYANGRGGRGGRGGGGSYQNGRGQQYYESGNYPRNYYNARGRVGGRPGGSSMYNSNHGGATREPRDAHVEASS
ncbi:uncharacterized protein M6B38_415635 [Iris pallida]|uniref:Uncharacterized protein n=1 Tax=Iris pallida TaxID=29817 RepID=A0AAX6FL80_IRIPA|nr:uncharacterized protein M6B38_415635 [Iris pallida]